MSKNIDRTTVFKIKTTIGGSKFSLSIFTEDNLLIFKDEHDETILVDKKSIKDVITVLTEIQESL